MGLPRRPPVRRRPCRPVPRPRCRPVVPAAIRPWRSRGVRGSSCRACDSRSSGSRGPLAAHSPDPASTGPADRPSTVGPGLSADHCAAVPARNPRPAPRTTSSTRRGSRPRRRGSGSAPAEIASAAGPRAARPSPPRPPPHRCSTCAVPSAPASRCRTPAAEGSSIHGSTRDRTGAPAGRAVPRPWHRCPAPAASASGPARPTPGTAPRAARRAHRNPR